MKLLGFNFTKVSAYREPVFAKIEKMTADVTFLEVEKEKLEMMKAEEIVKVSFRYTVKYDPKQAEILLEGQFILSLTEEESKELMKTWKKKQFPESMKIPLFNLVFTKCNLRALQLEEELNLPLHLKLPRVSNKEN